MFICRLLWKLLSPSMSSVSRCLHLKEYERGVFHDDDGTSTAWVEMDVPPVTTHPETKQKTLYGEPSPSQVDAYRTLDEAIVR
jgi:hypothetical protein